MKKGEKWVIKAGSSLVSGQQDGINHNFLKINRFNSNAGIYFKSEFENGR